MDGRYLNARAYARAYAERGWPVFPLRARTKRPATPNGHRDATTCPEAIESWWWRWQPDAGVGIATGGGLVVVDIDRRNGGLGTLQHLDELYGPLPVTPTVETADGWHCYFAHDGAPLRCRNNVAGYRGIDLKADGGYVVAPPSVHPGGRRYAWHAERNLETLPLARLPDWFAELARMGPDAERVRYSPTGGAKLSERTLRVIREHGEIRERFLRRPGRHPDRSDSGIDMSLARLLALRGVAPTQIEAAIRESRRRAGLPRRRRSYFANTVGKALHDA